MNFFLFLHFLPHCECVGVCLSSSGVHLGVISSQQGVSKLLYLKLVEMSRRSRSSTMLNEVSTSTRTLQAPRVESSMLTLFLC